METQDIKITETFPDTSKDAKQYNCNEAQDGAEDYFQSRNGGKPSAEMVEDNEMITPIYAVQLMHDFARKSLRDELIKFAKEFNKNCESVFIEDEFINLYLNSKGLETKG